MKQLCVYHEDVLVGYLSEDDEHGMFFKYTNNWLTNKKAIALSPDLHLSSQIYQGDSVTSFFENLLPEGDVLDFISQAVHISSDNVFGLLERFGGDTAGTFSILPEGMEPSKEPRYLTVTTEEIKKWFQQTRGIPLNINGEQARMSLSGAQDKMTVFIDANNSISIPLGSAPSSHIIKPSINHRQDIPNTAINEVLVMTLAREVKLNVVDIRYDSVLCAAIITRYDRTIDKKGRLSRQHQNDLCQLTGIQSNKKYEAEGGPSIKDCFNAVLKNSSQPAKDKKRLIEWVVFNVLVGNMDSHAKNLSLLTVANKVELTPFYDMICTAVYPNLSQKFAFKIGGENRPNWMMAHHWERFANDIDTKPKFVINIMTDMVQRMEKVLPVVVENVKEITSLSDEELMIEKIEIIIDKALSKMKSRITNTTLKR